MKQGLTKKILVLCDLDETYAFRMAEYVTEKGKIPYALHLFTKPEKLKAFLEENETAALLISEGAWKELQGFKEWNVQNLFVLLEDSKGIEESRCGEAKQQYEEEFGEEYAKESGEESGKESAIKGHCWYLSKYQSPEKILHFLTEKISETDDFEIKRSERETKLKLIGIYSPVRRCLQTSFALTMGQLLSREHKVLYLNFESYSGFSQMMQREFAGDMSDMVYYFRCAKEKMSLRLPSLVQNVNGLDFIPPGQAFPDLQAISGRQWIEILQTLEQISDYEYLILDLTDSMNGLLELLSYCCKIYTIIKEDSFAMAKMKQYEEILQISGLQEIADKTVKCRFPFFEKLPSQLHLMTHGELAGYVKAIIQEDLYEQTG